MRFFLCILALLAVLCGLSVSVQANHEVSGSFGKVLLTLDHFETPALIKNELGRMSPLSLSTLRSLHFQGIFSAWVKKHKKNYEISEVFHRLNTFKANAIQVFLHNTHHDEPAWTQAINKYADLTKDEFRTVFLGSRIEADKARAALNVTDFATFDPRQVEALGTTDLLKNSPIDWVAKGVVGPVKDQGECGSCWTFSSICPIEARYSMQTGRAISLSEQQLLDCDKTNSGCDGGDQLMAFNNMVRKSMPLCTEQEYPYEEDVKKCKNYSKVCRANVKVTRGVRVGASTELVAQALTLGPLSASISTDSDSMQFYHGGIMNPKHCSDDVDHAIVIVGMGSSNGVGYWKLRNSWGSDWGEEGYFRMHRAVRESMCGITSDVSYPLVKVL